VPGAHRLDEPLAKVLGVRSKGAGLTQLGLHTVGDLLRHYPRRYQRWGDLTPLRQLPEDEEVTILAEVVKASSRQMKTRRGELLQCVVSDGTDTLDLTFFNARNLKRALVPGRVGLFSGVVGRYQGRPQLTHPKLHLLDAVDDAEAAVAGLEGPIPVYPASAKLDSEAIRRSVGVVLDILGEVPDPLPVEVRARHGLLGLREAFVKLHRPGDDDDRRAAQRRLRFEEAFVLQAALARRRAAEGALAATARRSRDDGLLAKFDRRLPFTLTAGQQAVGEQLTADLAQEHPMHRLLQGEVGSGKTVVALRAMLTVVDGGGQAALLARRRCWRCSTTARSPRSSAISLPPVSSAATSAVPGSPCSPGRCRPPSAGPRCSTSSAASPGSPSAPTPCCRRRWSSSTSAWSSSTSSTGSAWSSGTPCAAKGAPPPICW
jgi:ATP-dependent DNA helicase RecG